MEDASFKPYEGWSSGGTPVSLEGMVKKTTDTFLESTLIQNVPSLPGSVPMRANPVPWDSLVAVPRGAGSSERSASTVYGYSLRIVGRVVLEPYVADLDFATMSADKYGVGIFVCLDKMTNGDPLDGPFAFYGADGCVCMRAVDAMDRMSIIHHEEHVFRPIIQAISGTPTKFNIAASSYPFDIVIPLKGLRFRFNGDDGTVDELSGYSVHFFIGNQAAVPLSGTLQMFVSYSCRFAWFEMP